MQDLLLKFEYLFHNSYYYMGTLGTLLYQERNHRDSHGIDSSYLLHIVNRLLDSVLNYTGTLKHRSSSRYR